MAKDHLEGHGRIGHSSSRHREMDVLKVKSPCYSSKSPEN